MDEDEQCESLYVAGPNASAMDDEIAELGRLLKQLSSYSPIELGKLGCVVAIKQAGDNGLTDSDMEIIAQGVAEALATVVPLSLAFENVIDIAVVDGEFGYKKNENSEPTLRAANRRIAENN